MLCTLHAVETASRPIAVRSHSSDAQPVTYFQVSRDQQLGGDHIVAAAGHSEYCRLLFVSQLCPLLAIVPTIKLAVLVEHCIINYDTAEAMVH